MDSSLEGTKQPLTPAKPVSIYTLHPKNLNPKNKPYTLNPKPVHSLDGTKLSHNRQLRARPRACAHAAVWFAAVTCLRSFAKP